MEKIPARHPLACQKYDWLLCSVVLLLAILVFTLYAQAAEPPDAEALPTQLHITQAEMLTLDADRYSAAPARFDTTLLSGTWTTVALPYAQGSNLLAQVDAPAHSLATTWYRLKVSDIDAGTSPLMLYAARIKGDGPIAVYVDGHLVHQRQLGGATWYWAPLWLALDAGERIAGPHEIVFRLQHLRTTHTAVASVWLGTSATLGWRYHLRQWLQVDLLVMSNGAFLAVGLFSFFVWLRRGKGAGYGLFALLATAQFIRALHFYVDLPVANDWFAWFSLNSLFWVLVILQFFLVLIHGRQQRWLTYSVIAAAVTVALLSLPVLATLPNTPQVTPLIYLLAMAATVAVTVAGIIASWRRSTEGLLVAAGLALAFLYGINDWALQSDFIGPENWYLGPYLSLQSFIVFCYLMHRRYIGALVQVEHSNLELAQRLQERENELARSYERLSEIEYRQTVAQERQRLMQDMHDGLGSSLHSALRAIERGKLDEISVADILRGCIDDLHLTIDSMEPVEADLLLLLATLRYRLGSRLQSAGITLHWQVVDVPQLDWLDPRTALHILRILQEALTNIVKHTSATEITVATAQEGAGVTVRIADNGAGFALVPALALGGRGLLNQQRRADAIGGNIGWDSTSAGTTVALWLPLSRNAIPHHLAGTVSPELVTDRLTKSWHKHGFVKP